MGTALDHELKLSRAFQHLQDLDAEIKSWLNSNQYSVRHEFNLEASWTSEPLETPPGSTSMLARPVFIPGQGPGTLPDNVPFGQGIVTCYATYTEQPEVDPISLLLGDALHNMRSGLDALAYALTVAYTCSPTEEMIERSEFPIFGDENRKGVPGSGPGLFQNNGGIKILGWDPRAKTAVEALQPYKRGNDFRSDPLWMLHDLDRVDKHRLLHTTVASFAGTIWSIAAFRNIRAMGPGLIQSFGGAVETDTPIARICGIHPIDPNTEMHVEIDPAMDVAFNNDVPVAAEQPVRTTLGAIYSHIRDRVFPALTPFL